MKRIADVRLLKSHQFPEDAGPLAHPVRPDTYREINNFYTATVYEKGAEVVRMLKTLLGPEEFRSGMDLYFERHDGEAATIEDFLACFADASGTDLTHFARWYAQAGTPTVSVSGEWNAAAQTYRLDISQHTAPTPGQPDKAPMVIPLRVGLVGPDGRDMALSAPDGGNGPEGVLVLTEARQSFTFRGVSERPVPSLNRGFSAPVTLKSGLSSDDLLFLARHDADPLGGQPLRRGARRWRWRIWWDATRRRARRPPPAAPAALIERARLGAVRPGARSGLHRPGAHRALRERHRPRDRRRCRSRRGAQGAHRPAQGARPRLGAGAGRRL